jgi:hypothetical protein
VRKDGDPRPAQSNAPTRPDPHFRGDCECDQRYRYEFNGTQQTGALLVQSQPYESRTNDKRQRDLADLTRGARRSRYANKQSGVTGH